VGEHTEKRADALIEEVEECGEKDDEATAKSLHIVILEDRENLHDVRRLFGEQRVKQTFLATEIEGFVLRVVPR
jgi:hypothetical protein